MSPPRLLFRLAVALALLLGTAVVAAPHLDAGAAAPHGWRRLIALFARDAVLRRTSLASAAGLLVTASVFFLPGQGAARPAPRPPRSAGGVGA
jgi:hypothetical protein